ncbi:MAG TPA: glycosyltransferase family A protein [Pirellulales bacterium]|nr:glycosyltransferase family A protein [Pirellulales bacterium]
MLISVVIPCFNGAAHLEECLASVRRQGVDCEIILVDDGSTDASVERATAWMRSHAPNLLLVCQHNQGPAAARNTGLRLAQGEYVGFLDIDDQYADGFLAEALARLQAEPELVAAYCRIELVDAHRPVQPWHLSAIEHSTPGNLIVRTEAARSLGGFPTDRAFRGAAGGEDHVFRSQVYRLGKVATIERPLLKHRVRRGSHFDLFLDRAVWRDGKLTATHFTAEELDGSFQRAVRAYETAVLARQVAQRRQTLAAAVEGLDAFLPRTGGGQPGGALHPTEAFFVSWLAGHWPAAGRAVSVGACGGLRAPAMSDLVDAHFIAEAQPSDDWTDPVRLLLLDGDAGAAWVDRAMNLWLPRVSLHGLVLFCGGQAQALAARLRAMPTAVETRWQPLPPIGGLRLFERLS